MQARLLETRALGALLPLLLVALHLAAASLPCPPQADPSAGAERTPELHAFCPCGCEGAAPATQSGQLGAALFPPAQPEAAKPHAAPLDGASLALPDEPLRTPEPVPRLA